MRMRLFIVSVLLAAFFLPTTTAQCGVDSVCQNLQLPATVAVLAEDVTPPEGDEGDAGPAAGDGDAADGPVVDSGAPDDETGGGLGINILWTVIAAILVFWMQAGFALVEAGFTRAKNVVNIMMKNLMDFSLGSILFWIVGFGIMFGDKIGGVFGVTMYAAQPTDQVWYYAFLLFQTVFAATAATIVSGAMAERTKFSAYLVYSVVITAFIYPVFGGWAWGSLWSSETGGDPTGWLEKLGFTDFAGSTVVHSIGGWAALAGAIVLGPRKGKFGPDGEARAIPGQSLALATLGAFILWMGWFGFNAGSTTSVLGSGENPLGGGGKALAFIALNTNMAAAGGALTAMITSWILLKKPDIGMALNGALAGLVGITAGCANVMPGSALVIGLIAGVIVVFSVLFFDKIKVDDPVGAVSVHGVCGAFGTLAAWMFDAGGSATLSAQLAGIGAAFAWGFGASLVLFLAIKYTMGLRVSAEEEEEGLDLGEHGAKGWHLE